VVTSNVSSLQTQNTQLANQLNAVSTNLTQAQTEITGINRRLVTRGPG
jgi:outer membrane murein-binding lipoprotein Lpp